MMNAPPRREYLGSHLGMAERMRVFRTPEALEIDTSDRYEIRRQRVFYDEIVLVTLHRERGGGPYPWFFGGLALIAGLLALAFSSSDVDAAYNVFLASAGLLGLFSVAGFLLTSWNVTVFGKRTRARIRYRLREGRARTVYDEIRQAAAVAQQRSAEVVQEPAPPEPSPPAPLPQAGEG